MSGLRQAPGHKHPLLWGELPPLGCAILSLQDNYQPRYLCQHLRSPLWRLKVTNRQYFTYGLKGLESFFVLVLLNCIRMGHFWVIFLFVLVCNGWFRIRCCFGPQTSLFKGMHMQTSKYVTCWVTGMIFDGISTSQPRMLELSWTLCGLDPFHGRNCVRLHQGAIYCELLEPTRIY